MSSFTLTGITCRRTRRRGRWLHGSKHRNGAYEEERALVTITNDPSRQTYSGVGTEFPGAERAAVIGGVGVRLAADQVREFVVAQLRGADLDGRRVCLVVPDGTRTCPLPLLLRAAHGALVGRASEVRVVIALGTHQRMSEDQLARHLGYQPGESGQTYPGWRIINHESWLLETFTTLGTISADRLAELTGGLMRDTSVTVRINRHVADADVAIVVGPVFPHEVVGFSGGNKYFFPGFRRRVGGNPHQLPRDAGPTGAVDHAGQVRRHLDRGKRFLQAGADRGRRR
jgi:hypothetical protein